MMKFQAGNAQEKDYLHFITRFGVPIIFVAMVIVFTSMNPVFFSFANLTDLLYSTAASGIAVIGTSIVLISGGLDLSLSSIMFGAGSITALTANANFPAPLVVLIAIVAGGLMGAVNGFFIARWKMTPLLVTLATQAIYRGLWLVAINEGYLHISNDFYNQFVQSKFLGLTPSVYLFGALAILFHLIMTKTKYGWHLYAIGNNIEASRKIGINTKRIQFSAYMLNGLFCGLAGFILVSMIGEISPSFALGNEFTMITGAVLGGIALTGGKGKIFPGAALGALMIYTIDNGLNIISANPYAYTIVRGLVIFVAVALDRVYYVGELR